jgi:arginyl-tRNA synthetase
MAAPLSELKLECKDLLEKALKKIRPKIKIPPIKLSIPPNLAMGDLSSPICFQISRKLDSQPHLLAKEIVGLMKTDSSSLIDSVDSKNGYINFHANTRNFNSFVIETVKIEDEKFGFITAEIPEKIMVEHTSANPNAPIHIGNARNSILGSCIAKILRQNGNDVRIHFLVNDMGRQVAIATFGWELLNKPEPEGRAEEWVGAIYAMVNVIIETKKIQRDIEESKDKRLNQELTELNYKLSEYEKAANELKKRNPSLFEKLYEKLGNSDDPQDEIVLLNTKYEKEDPSTVENVRNLVKYCLEGFQETLGEIGILFDSFDYESDIVWRRAADDVLDKLKKTKYVFEDGGALILDCDKIAEDYRLKERWGLNPEHEIPRLVLIRKDGTTLYTLRDIAYSIWKFGMVDRVINVIGYDQTLAQLQLRIALVALSHIEMGDNQLHYAYEFVNLPGVKMSGRLGRYVTLNEVLERSIELALKEVTVRNPGMSLDEKTEIARMVGHGAVKYTLLAVDPMKKVVFDWDRALNFETNSAPFIQYSHARACNILKKAEKIPHPDYSKLSDPKERELILSLAMFPEVFESVANELKPSELTAYTNILADKFNSFYASLPVLKAADKGLSGARLSLVEAFKIVIRNALFLLGIKSPERM